MRVRVGDSDFAVRATAGNHVVLLGMDIGSDDLQGFRGFGIERTDHTENERYWLKNMLCFECNDAGTSDMPIYTTQENPVQAFLWGDYTCKPDHDYTYSVHAMYGTAKNLVAKKSIDVRVQTADPDAQGHAVYFNRGAAASQAYVRKFGYKNPHAVPNGEAMAWLSRGLHEALLAFIESAKDDTYELHAAVYEFQCSDVLAAFKAASKRGATVDVIYDAIAKKSTKKANVAAIKAAGIVKLTTPRANSSYIAHNKFIVLSKDARPIEVWTGSTNMTEGGIFGHSNVGHRIANPELAAAYLEYWKSLSEDPDAAALKKWTDAHSPLPDAAKRQPITPVFSPRPTTSAMDLYANMFDDVNHAAFFTAPFGVDKRLRAVMEKRKPYLRYIIEDTGRNGVEVTNRNPNNRVAVGASIPTGGFAQWVREKLSGFNKHATYIHTKYMILDPFDTDGTVITGSANFSDASINRNDENSITIVGDQYVNDVYLTEFMRLFNHYAFRAAVKKQLDAANAPDVIHLKDDDKWYRRFYKQGSPEEKERLYFST